MDFNFDINNALTNANQFGQVQGNQPKEFNPEDALNLFRNSLQKVAPAESKMGSIPAVYGDSQMNLTFDRYYMHPNYDSLGFSPWRDNDTMYNANSTWLDNLGRSTKAMASIAMESFGSNKPFISTLDLFDPLNYDEESAGEISRLMKIGYDTSGGLGGFVNNFVLNTGITLGIAGSAIIEQQAINAVSSAFASSGVGTVAGGATFLGGTALNLAKLGKRLGQVIDANKLLLNITKNIDEMKSVYNFSKLAKKMDSSAVVDFFNPLSSTTKLLAEYPETFKGLNALGKTAMTFGAFYNDARRSARVLNEAQLEGGLVVNQMVEDAIRKEYDLTGLYPSEEKIQAFTDNARKAAFATTMINLPLIHFSDKVGLDNILANVPKGKNLLKNLDEVTPFGDFVKQKGVGYKHIDSNWKKLTTSMKPVTLGKNFLNYARYNFSEAIQENLQEATSSGVINYYEKLFNNPTIDQNELLRQSISKGLGEQFTAQGLETFASGFLTGGLIGGLGKAAGFGMNSFQRLYDKKGWDEYVTKRNEFIKQAEESLNILDKSFLDLGAGMGDIFNPNAVNAAQQSGASRVIRNATEGNNVKLQKDAQRLALFEHVYNAIKIGKFNTVVDSYKEMLNMDDKTFAEAFNIDLNEVGNTRSKVSKAIKQAEGIKERFDKYNFQNPVNLNGVSKDDPNYNKLVAKRNAIETVKKILIMSEDSVADGVNRLKSITQSITNILPEFGEIDSDDILSFIDPHRLDAYKLKQLDREIQLQKETSTSPGISAEDKKTAEDKLKYLIQKKSSIVEVANKLTNFRNKLSNNEEFTDTEREELTAAFKAHLDVLNTNPETRSTNYSTEAVDEALDYITDYAKLEAENNILTSVISVLQDPEGFAKTVDDTTSYLEGVLQNTQMYANMLNRAISLNELNAMYNYMFNNHGVFVIETEEGKYYFAKPGPNANDPFIILSETDDDFNKIEDDYLDFKERILKNEELEKVKVKKEAVKKKREELETTLDKIRKFLKRDKNLTDKEIEERIEVIRKNPFALALYSQMMLDVVKAQDIEDASDASPTTVEEALDALSALELASFKLTDDNKNYVQIDPETGELVDPEFLWDRVTSLFKTEEDKRQIQESSTHRGNIMDGLLRLMIDNPNVSQEEFDAEYESLKANNGKAPKFNKEILTSLREVYTSIIEEATKKKWTLKANIPTLWGEINGKKVAGTIDIIAIKENGDVIIIDLKTSKFNRQNQYNIEDDLKTIAGPLYDSIKEKIKKNSNKLDGASFTEEEQKVIDSFKKKHNVESIFFYKDSDVQQLSAYAELLRQRTGINVKTLAISPFIVKTDKLGTNITNVSRIPTIIVDRSAGPKFESKSPAAGAQPGSGSTDAKRQEVRAAIQKAGQGEGGQFFVTLVDGTREAATRISLVGNELGVGNKGVTVDLSTIVKVENPDGTVLYDSKPTSVSTDAKADVERRKKESLNSIVESYDKGTDLTIGKAIITKADGTKESISDLKDVVTTGDPFQRLKDKIEAIYKQELDALEGTALQKGEKGKNETLTEEEELIEEEPLTEEKINKFLIENINKEVIINNIKGTLSKEGVRYVLVDENTIYEINPEDIVSFSLPVEEKLITEEIDIDQKIKKSSYKIINGYSISFPLFDPTLGKETIIVENPKTGKGMLYIINTNDIGTVISITPINKTDQEITNEKLLIAVEIERNRKEYNSFAPNKEENVVALVESLKNNYPNLDVMLDNIWSLNLTNTIAEGLDKLYNNQSLTEEEKLQVSIWLRDVFDRISKLITPQNSKEENDTLLQAYNTAEIINSLLYELNNLTLNENGKPRKTGTDVKKVKSNVDSKKSKDTIKKPTKKEKLPEVAGKKKKSKVLPKTSKIDVTKILDNGVMMYPIYKNNVLQGYVSYSQIEKSFNFFTPNKKLSTNKKISSAFLKDNPDLFKYWFENLLNDGDRDYFKKQYFEYNAAKEIGNEAEIKKNIESYGIPISEFTKNEELLTIENRELPEEYVGKLIYGTPGVGKTFFVESYNGKYEVIDVDKLLFDRLEELNAESNFAEGLEFTNENLVPIIAKLYESVRFNDAEVDAILYKPVLQLINNKKKEGAILFTGTKRFIKESDIAIIAKDRTEVLSKKIKTDIKQIRDYQIEENKYIRDNKGKIILLDEGVYLNDVIYGNLEQTSRENAEAIFKQRMLNILKSNPQNFSLYLAIIKDFEKIEQGEITQEETTFYNTVYNYLKSNSPTEVYVSSYKEIFIKLQNYYQSLQNKVFSELEPIMKDIILNRYQEELNFIDSNSRLITASRRGDKMVYTLRENAADTKGITKEESIKDFEQTLKKGKFRIIYTPVSTAEEFDNKVNIVPFNEVNPPEDFDPFNNCPKQ